MDDSNQLWHEGFRLFRGTDDGRLSGWVVSVRSRLTELADNAFSEALLPLECAPVVAVPTITGAAATGLLQPGGPFTPVSGSRLALKRWY